MDNDWFDKLNNVYWRIVWNDEKEWFSVCRMQWFDEEDYNQQNYIGGAGFKLNSEAKAQAVKSFIEQLAIMANINNNHKVFANLVAGKLKEILNAE